MHAYLKNYYQQPKTNKKDMCLCACKPYTQLYYRKLRTQPALCQHKHKKTIKNNLKYMLANNPYINNIRNFARILSFYPILPKFYTQNIILLKYRIGILQAFIKQEYP